MDEQFKIQLAAEIKKLSMALSPDMNPMEKDKLRQMVNMICEQITLSKLSTNIETYRRIINRIISGELKLYQFNVVNLMTAFQTQKEFIYNGKL